MPNQSCPIALESHAKHRMTATRVLKSHHQKTSYNNQASNQKYFVPFSPNESHTELPKPYLTNPDQRIATTAHVAKRAQFLSAGFVATRCRATHPGIVGMRKISR
jgi:hypothetical protein